MTSHLSFPRAFAVIAFAALVAVGCGPGQAGVGGNGGGSDAGVDAGGGGGGTDAGGVKTCDPSWFELCDGVDNNCDGKVDEGFDLDHDGVSSCGATPDCDDNDDTVFPGATETANGKDDNCDGKIDFRAPGVDYDQDGTPFPEDCDDDNALVGPNAVEVAFKADGGMEGVDNDCDGTVDNVIDCEAQISGTTGGDFAKAIGLCGGYIQNATFPSGNSQARAIRARFGTNFTPKDGAKLIQLSSGKAVDNYDDNSYKPETGTELSGSTQNQPLWSAADCYAQSTAPKAHDLSEFKISMKVPQNAKSLSYQVNFFSAEYPDFVCTQYNDRFVAILESNALDPSKLPGGAAKNCIPGTGTPQCNISFDVNGQPLTINSGFFDICKTDPKVPYTCGKPASLLEKTGYDQILSGEYSDGSSGPLGGATGWLTTRAPVTPGETITLRFVILDEGDGIYDSTVLIDNFKWELQTVDAPTTVPIN